MSYIEIEGAVEHNLNEVDIQIPKEKLVVFTGVSGSGKSSLVFSTIYAEAQRQLLDTFSAYTRSRIPKVARPKVKNISNLPVAIVIDQKRLGGNSSSTVGTVTEIYNLLRLLYSRCGTPHIGDSVNFSFNRPEGMCPVCKGSGTQLTINEDIMFDWELSLAEGSLQHPKFKLDGWVIKSIFASNFFDINKPLKEFTREELDTLLYSEKIKMNNKTEEIPVNLTFSGIAKSFHSSEIRGKKDKSDEKYYKVTYCKECNGSRINHKARSVKFGGKTIIDLCRMEFTELRHFFKEVYEEFNSFEQQIAESILSRIDQRLKNLVDIGIGYLSLDRRTSTLSGGESQRVKMARQLDCDLTGLVYILDEPSIGLHPSDINNLINIMIKIRDKGNSLFVIEHDETIIESADYIVDVGPGGGSNGGAIVFEGNYKELISSNTLTATYLEKKGNINSFARNHNGYFHIENAQENNLKNISVNIPKGLLVCITGVAGSGKSTLINQSFISKYSDAIIIDQSSVSRSRRSTPASYTKVLDLIRKEIARSCDKDPGLFSFNSIGACPNCKGMGELEIEMHFLESVTVECDKCKGKRFKNEVLEIKYKGLNIADILGLTISEAINFFEHKEILRRLKILEDVGLDYLTLGQSLSTLSGGEAQRVKLGSELRKKGNIYIMDEPTTGLHMSDIAKLSSIIHKLVDSGNSVILIEHNLELISQSDWIIDMGPEGGARGGYIVAEGTPEQLCDINGSKTGHYLKKYRFETINIA